MTKIQTIIFPKLDINAPEDLYFRGERASDATTFEEGGIRIPKGEKCTLDTYFNGFSVRPWKDNTTVNDLSARLHGTGKIRVRVGLHVFEQSTRWLTEKVITLNEAGVSIPIDSWKNLKEGLIYLELLAQEDSHLVGGYFETATPPNVDVKLGIVVTHFNRKHYVLPAMRRVSEELLSDPDYKDNIELIVVDNSRNILPDEAGKATVIPNQNLGGSGGFTRGLLHLMDNGFTHCLFMDDDASCEIESIRRTYRIMQFAKDNKLAIAGSMLLEEKPSVIHEAGGAFSNGSFRPLKNGLDVRDLHQLLILEKEYEPVGYGAWWHFAFSIDAMRHYPFPFFVRGDDILFSLLNDFRIETLNGVAVWAEDFAIKESPMTRYLGMRCTVVLMLLTSSKSVLRHIKVTHQWFKASNLAYNYSSAAAIRLAVQHVMQGPEFWKQNMDMSKIRPEIAKTAQAEQVTTLKLPSDAIHKHIRHRRSRSLLQKITLNGFLIPNFLLKSKTVIDTKSYTGNQNLVFRHKQVAYRVANSNRGYIAKHDKKRFFSEYFQYWKTMLQFALNFKKLRKQYRDELPDLTSQTFWKSVYKTDDDKKTSR